jgi:hypothetical protein
MLQVGALRRNMLRLIGVSEFSDAAEWHDPCQSVMLSEVHCQACNYCHELDLVRSCRWNNLEDPGDGRSDNALAGFLNFTNFDYLIL